MVVFPGCERGAAGGGADRGCCDDEGEREGVGKWVVGWWWHCKLFGFFFFFPSVVGLLCLLGIEVIDSGVEVEVGRVFWRVGFLCDSLSVPTSRHNFSC